MSGARALVVSESAYGTTTEIAEHIGASLEAVDHVVDVRHVSDVGGVAGYDLVVVGSPIRYERWTPGATEFVRTHLADLTATRVGFFFTCLALSKPGPRSARSADRYEATIRAIAPELEPVTVGRFAGAVDPSRMHPFLRTAARAVLALRGVTAGDHRDWNAVDSWATRLVAEPDRR